MNYKNLMIAIFTLGFSGSLFASNIQTSRFIDLPTAFADGKGPRSLKHKSVQRTIQSENHKNDFNVVDLVFGKGNVQVVADFLKDIETASATQDDMTEVASKVKPKKNNRSVASVLELTVNCGKLLDITINYINLQTKSEDIAQVFYENNRQFFSNLQNINPADFADEVIKKLDEAVAKNELTPKQAGLLSALLIEDPQSKMLIQAMQDAKNLKKAAKVELDEGLEACVLKAA